MLARWISAFHAKAIPNERAGQSRGIRRCPKAKVTREFAHYVMLNRHVLSACYCSKCEYAERSNFVDASASSSSSSSASSSASSIACACVTPKQRDIRCC